MNCSDANPNKRCCCADEWSTARLKPRPNLPDHTPSVEVRDATSADLALIRGFRVDASSNGVVLDAYIIVRLGLNTFALNKSTFFKEYELTPYDDTREGND